LSSSLGDGMALESKFCFTKFSSFDTSERTPSSALPLNVCSASYLTSTSWVVGTSLTCLSSRWPATLLK